MIDDEARSRKVAEVTGPTVPPSARHPTPIPISKRTRNLIILGLVALLALLLWAAPVVLVAMIGGLAVALVLSFPVSLLSRFMPKSLAILLSFVFLLAVLLLAAYVLLPMIVTQTAALVGALPDLIGNLERIVVGALEALDRNNLLPGTPQDVAARIGEDLRRSLGVVTRNILGGTVGFVFGTFSFVLMLFAMGFVAASLLANVRGFKASYLVSISHRYRRDALTLWNDLAHALSRYLAGLALVLVIQGAISAIALYLIGVPYPLALGAWVSITAVIPYLGAWIGAIPAVLVAASISWNAVLLTALAFLAIQQLEGNFLTPRIQGQTTGAPSVVVFLAVIAGGALFGFLGVLFAVPAVAVLRVLYDFFRVRLRTEPAL